MPIHDHAPNSRGRAAMWIGIALGVVFLALLLTHGFGFFDHGGTSNESAAAMVHKGDQIIVPDGSPLRARLSVEAATAVASSAKLVVPGIIEADPGRSATVLPPLGGRVLQVRVRLGDRVVAGQELAVLDSPDLAQAYDDDDRALATRDLATRNLERQDQQHKIGAASDRDLDQARSDAAQAQADYTRTQARLRVLGATRAPGDTGHHLIIKSPVSGSITSLSVVPGTMVNDPTQPIMTVADLSTVWVTAMVAEGDLPKLTTGQDAEVSLVAKPAQTLHGKVLFIADVVDPDTRRTRVRIAFANAALALKPNMFATVTLASAAQPRVTVPSTALLMNNDRTSVFVATAPWTFERRTVETDLEEGDLVTLRAGVNAGEQVVVRGAILLND